MANIRLVKWNKLPERVRKDLAEAYQFNASLGEAETAKMVELKGPEEVFDEWLQWNGIVGYGGLLFEMPALIKAASQGATGTERAND